MTGFHSPRVFGRTGRLVVPIGLGTHGHGHAFGGTDKAESLAILRAISSFGTGGEKVLVDVAPRYGHGKVESWFGELADSEKQRFLVATKGGRHIDPERDNQKDFSPRFLEEGLADSLRRMKVESVFLFQLHNPSLLDIRRGDIFGILESLANKGMMEWYGISIDNASEGDAVLDAVEAGLAPRLASIQAIYSPLTKLECSAMFDRAHKLGVAVVAREVLVRGLLTDSSLDYSNSSASAVRKIVEMFGKAQLEDRRTAVLEIADAAGMDITSLAVGYVLANRGVSVALVGCNRLAHLEVDWVFPELPQAIVRAIDELSDLEHLVEL